MKISLQCINTGSQSAKRIAEGLTPLVKHKVFRRKDAKPGYLNLLYGDLKDKVYQYEWFNQQKLPAPAFTKSKSEAAKWISEGNVIFCRTLTKSQEGKGIVVAETGQELCNAPVYTAYVKKKSEFRVHIFKNKVVSVLEKRRKKEFAGESDPRIRNTANGYVFCHDNVVEPPGLRDLALKSRKVTASDFAGVDIGYNEHYDELFVIEVNSAPGIEGSNVDRYIEAIKQEYTL